MAAGAKVVVASRKADACAATEEHLRALGGDVLAVPTHMGNLDDLTNLVDRTVERFGGIDIVVNNAANALAQPLGEFTIEAWTKSFDVNLRGPVFLVQAALPHLKTSDHAAVLNVICTAWPAPTSWWARPCCSPRMPGATSPARSCWPTVAWSPTDPHTGPFPNWRRDAGSEPR